MFVPAGFALLILCAALNSGVPAQVLNSRPLRFLGDISYSIYLLQMFWLFLWNAWIDLSWKAANPPADAEPRRIAALARRSAGLADRLGRNDLPLC